MADKIREALTALLPHARGYIEQAIREGSCGEAEMQALARVEIAEKVVKETRYGRRDERIR